MTSSTEHVETTEVVIAGGGPVGLTLAHELGSRGIGCVLLEPRPEPSLASPRCKQMNPRSMEIFRRLGIADAVRGNARLPFGWSDSAVFCTALTGHRLERFDGVFALSDVQRPDLAEPALWCAQNHVEEALRDTLTRRETVSARWGWTLTGVEQDATGVTATATDDAGRERVVRGRYLVGADGARSAVRRACGIPLTGRSHEIRNVQVIFDAPGLSARHRLGRAVQYWVVNPEVNGLMGMLTTDDLWWAIIINAREDADAAWYERAVHRMIGAEEPITVTATDPWTARMLVADRYRDGRCFLAGDAAHQNPPWGGFGANTGIGDAADLGWKLTAALRGWAGDDLLDSYETERRPIARRAIAEAERNMRVLTGELAVPGLDGDGPDGRALRAKTAELIRQAKTAEMYTLGFVLGTAYPGSPIVLPDDGPAPASTGTEYRPSGAPGNRLPHQWLSRNRSLQDELGPGFTLLEIAAPPAPEWEPAAATAGVPLTRYRLNRPDLHGLYAARYVLVRPDGYIAWRGEASPGDPRAVLDHARGQHG
ncbi:monooxygenase [Amycolatopsis sp. NBRC 101858]|uniref:FAD-dependent monooxygenase n=1 Tax=Amycolatopsis sp. NBRC 101858 TaxID=3032200 RepID=UPI0024A2E6B3|nr:FAD-dependent monooxygenase [Amycolatopsis sp. NBRC 101858]GLY43167.1 monooxygenase [Amycolatopsis sp. NBRC 101858]